MLRTGYLKFLDLFQKKFIYFILHNFFFREYSPARPEYERVVVVAALQELAGGSTRLIVHCLFVLWWQNTRLYRDGWKSFIFSGPVCCLRLIYIIIRRTLRYLGRWRLVGRKPWPLTLRSKLFLQILRRMQRKLLIWSIPPRRPLLINKKLVYLVQRRTSWLYFTISIYYRFCQTFILSLLVSICFSIYFIHLAQIQFLKQLALWFIVFNLFFWLMSGFNYFLKRYRFGKFTSAIQRFWKRAFTCFWVVEGVLFLLFFYYFLNSSQEPLYAYDSANLNQEFLLSLHAAYINAVILALIIFFLLNLILCINYLPFHQALLIFGGLSILIFFSFFIETYQLFYILNGFCELTWVYSDEFSTWVLELEGSNLRVKTYYFILCLLAKYWHFLFIFISWVFFLLKCFESKRITYNLLAYNIQNWIILYVLNLLCYIQWVKWVGHRFLEVSYFWFFTNPVSYSVSYFFTQLLTYFQSYWSSWGDSWFTTLYLLISYTQNSFVHFTSDSIFLFYHTALLNNII